MREFDISIPKYSQRLFDKYNIDEHIQTEFWSSSDDKRVKLFDKITKEYNIPITEYNY